MLNERDGVLAERTYSVWPDLEALMREHGVPQFTVDGAPPGRRVRPARRELLHRARLHQPAHRPRPGRHPAARRGPRPTTHPIVLAGGHAAFNPEPIADFIDGAVLGDGEEAVLRRSPTSSGTGRPQGRPGGRDGLLPRAGRDRRRLRPALLRRDLPADGAIAKPSPEPPRRAPGRRQAHRDGPGRVAVPEASRSSRWPRPCTSATAWRSSAAAPAAAVSARPG